MRTALLVFASALVGFGLRELSRPKLAGRLVRYPSDGVVVLSRYRRQRAYGVEL